VSYLFVNLDSGLHTSYANKKTSRLLSLIYHNGEGGTAVRGAQRKKKGLTFYGIGMILIRGVFTPQGAKGAAAGRTRG
jgi:hypothetical protein